MKRTFSITEDAASHEEIRDRLLSGGKVTGTNMCVMVCAILIASVGLNADSVAVIIALSGGYSIATRQWAMLGGAAYLFAINTYFIFLSASVVLSLLRIPKVQELTPEQWKKLRRRMIRNTILIVLPSIGISIYMALTQ